ncbi:MAG: acetylglutamate kinase [Cryobacterium sp.]|nr:acetylglutamate kinase [Cryobacterium sp.]
MDNWVDSLRGKTVVVKFGGNAMIDDDLAASFGHDIVALQGAGVRVIVTHGGGPQISSALVAQGIPSEFREGLRVTSREAVAVVREVLVRIGAELADRVSAAGGSAETLSGDTHGLFLGRIMTAAVDGEAVELGQVGEVSRVNLAPIEDALARGAIPIVSAIAVEEASGELLNVNADSAAAALAAAIKADWLLLLTDVAGLYRDWPDTSSLISTIDSIELATLTPTLQSGMIPKVDAALHALAGGVARVRIMDGRTPHLLVAAPSGTTIFPPKGSINES